MLASGPEFKLRRKPVARLFSALLSLAALGWGAFDLWAGFRWVGIGTVILALAFIAQLVKAERDTVRLENAELRSLHLRLPVAEIEGIHVQFGDTLARAWLKTTKGEQVALVEGDEQEVRRITDRLAGTLQLAALPHDRLN
jgi:hypothetical protein